MEMCGNVPDYTYNGFECTELGHVFSSSKLIESGRSQIIYSRKGVLASTADT